LIFDKEKRRKRESQEEVREQTEVVSQVCEAGSRWGGGGGGAARDKALFFTSGPGLEGTLRKLMITRARA